MKKSLTYIVVMATLFISLQSVAAPQAYIKLPESFWSAHRVVVDGKEYSVKGISGFTDLPDAMKSNPLAVSYAEKYLSYKRTSTILLFSGLGAALTYILVTPLESYNSTTYWALFFAGFIPGIYFGQYSQIYLTRAVNIYNGFESGGTDMPANSNVANGHNPLSTTSLESQSPLTVMFKYEF
jgi:hypothetical protein